jgi:pilus assembly protein CpaB
LKIFRNRTTLGVLCILLSLVICFGVTPLFSRSASEKATIIRVTTPIQEGDEITSRMVETVEVGAYNLPAGIMTDKNQVVGKYATAALAVGDSILVSKLSNQPAAENAYLYQLDGTKQAISVTIKSFATGLSGKLKSGDIVSVIVADFEGKGEPVVPPELQYVEVISVTAASGYDANTGQTLDEKELPSTVTFLVTTQQAKTLAQLEQESEIHLALVYRGDPENAASFIQAQDALIQQLYSKPESEESEGTE